MAKVPEELFKRKPRCVKDLQPGERAQVALCSIVVDFDRNAFIFPAAELAPPFDKQLEYGDIWIDDQGQYHVDLKNARKGWKPQDLTLWKKASMA